MQNCKYGSTFSDAVAEKVLMSEATVSDRILFMACMPACKCRKEFFMQT